MSTVPEYKKFNTALLAGQYSRSFASSEEIEVTYHGRRKIVVTK
jgi:hypothetical protein